MQSEGSEQPTKKEVQSKEIGRVKLKELERMAKEKVRNRQMTDEEK